MKKIFLALAIAVLLFTSCATTDLTPQQKFILERHFGQRHPDQVPKYQAFKDDVNEYNFYCDVCGWELDD